jgi:hypothetical protein
MCLALKTSPAILDDEEAVMIDKDVCENQEKENTRRYLLANMLYSGNTVYLKGSHSRWNRFWQGLFRKDQTY